LPHNLGAASVKDAPPLRAPIRFGVFELDPESGELRKQGLKVRLQEQPFQILQILLEQPGKLVTREELQQRVWPADTFVDFDQGLYNATKKLREALGDSADTPRYVETLSRRGYRFIGSVKGNGSVAHAAAEVPPTSPTAETRPSRRKMQLGIALGLGTALLGAVLSVTPANLWQRLLGKGTVPQIRSLAVLPLQNLSADTAQEYFSDGMTDALITDLAQIGSLKVISRTSSMQYKQTKKSLPEIARELNVDGIIEGTVQRSGDRVRITAQLIHGPSDKHLWASSYERNTRDIFALERDLTKEIAHQVQTRLGTVGRAPLPQPRPIDPKVLDAYVQGNYHLHGRGRGAGDEENKEAQQYFQQAIDADPNFAPAYIGLACAHDNLLQGSNENLAIMRKAAEKAVELDPSSSDAWAALGQAKNDTWDWNGAEEEYRRAIALNPNNAQAHHGLGDILDTTGRLDEGWKEYQVAQQLDPNQDHLALALYGRGEFDRAIEIRQKIAQRDPGEGINHYFLALNYAQKGMYKEFVQEMGTSATLIGMPELANRLHRAYDESGYQGALRQWAKDLEHLAATKQLYVPGVLAQVYTALRDKDRALYWLEQFHQHHDLAAADPTCFKTDPWLAPLRSDPRFSDFLRRVGLPP
jgi:TolB-like protein/DNA-binding winged helix-turn-helix (wHTH) protein